MILTYVNTNGIQKEIQLWNKVNKRPIFSGVGLQENVCRFALSWRSSKLCNFFISVNNKAVDTC